MAIKYIVTLTAKEREELNTIIKKGTNTAKIRKAFQAAGDTGQFDQQGHTHRNCKQLDMRRQQHAGNHHR